MAIPSYRPSIHSSAGLLPLFNSYTMIVQTTALDHTPSLAHTQTHNTHTALYYSCPNTQPPHTFTPLPFAFAHLHTPALPCTYTYFSPFTAFSCTICLLVSSSPVHAFLPRLHWASRIHNARPHLPDTLPYHSWRYRLLTPCPYHQGAPAPALCGSGLCAVCDAAATPAHTRLYCRAVLVQRTRRADASTARMRGSAHVLIYRRSSAAALYLQPPASVRAAHTLAWRLRRACPPCPPRSPAACQLQRAYGTRTPSRHTTYRALRRTARARQLSRLLRAHVAFAVIPSSI